MLDPTQRLVRLGMWTTPGVGAAALRHVLGHGDGRSLPPSTEELRRARAALPLAEVRGAEAEARAARLGARWIVRGDAGWPAAVEALTWPVEALCVRGVMPRRSVAIVGARACDAETRSFARALARRLVAAGVDVLSGGAIGVDAAAHRGALEARGRTVAVLGSGLARLAPTANLGLFADLVAAGGGLVTEFPDDEVAWPRNFPRRNRLVAALSEATVVVRAAEASGTMYTADAAEALGRRLLARVGGGAGCSALIARGATPVRDVDEALVALGVASTPPSDGLLGALAEPLDLPTLARRLGRDEALVATELAAHLAAGRIRAFGAGRFVR